jgi:hypothetical protein
MLLAIPWLLDLRLAGNLGTTLGALNRRARQVVSAGSGGVGPGTRELLQRVFNKTNNLPYAPGLKVIVMRVWTDTARPFMV